MQEIAFAYGKEEKEVAISALQSTLPHGRQGDLDEQAVWRATRAVVSVVINAANGDPWLSWGVGAQCRVSWKKSGRWFWGCSEKNFGQNLPQI